MQPINMIIIFYWNKKLKKKWLHVLEADIITIKKNIDLMSRAKKMHFLRDDRHCAFLSNNALSY